MAEYTSQRISELQDATKITDRDLLVINEFSTEAGYTLTKKVSAGMLAEYVRLRTSDQTIGGIGLKELAYLNSTELLEKYMLSGHEQGTVNATASLALSTLGDLNLGNLAYQDKDSLDLDSFVKKHDATKSHTGSSRQYVNSIVQSNGVITNVTFGDLDEKLPVDESFLPTSKNPVTNAAITAALAKKVDKTEATADYPAEYDVFVTGLTQQDGKIINVSKQAFKHLTVDSAMDKNSTNPVQNKVISEKLEQLESSLTSNITSNFVKKSEAAAAYTAGSNQYIYSIQLKDGRVSNVLYRNLPTQQIVNTSLYVQKSDANAALVAPSGKYISGITQQNGKIVNIQTATLPLNTTTVVNSGITYTSVSDDVITGSGNVNGGYPTDKVVFTAKYDCILNLTVKLLTDINSCGYPNPRYVWLNDKVICTMERANSGITNCPMILKKGDTLKIRGACGSFHGTEYSFSGTYLNRSQDSSGNTTVVSTAPTYVYTPPASSTVAPTTDSGTIGTLMTKYAYTINYNGGDGNIGVYFTNAKNGSYVDASREGYGVRDYVSRFESPGYLFVTPGASGWGSERNWYDYSYAKCFNSYNDAMNHLKKKVVTLVF